MKRLRALILISALLTAPSAYADPPSVPTPGINAAIARVRFDGDLRDRSVVWAPAAGTARHAQKAKAAIGLGLMGMLLGAWVGATSVRRCGCGPGSEQAGLVGMTAGGVAGAIVGWQLGR